MTGNIPLFIGGIGFGGPWILILLVLWLWALVDLLRSNFKNSTEKLIWAVVIIFVPVLGALLYLLIGRSQKTKHL